MVRAPALAFVTAILLVSGAAWGNQGGLAGYTGKPYPGTPQGQSCNQCHNGGTAPGVVIDGPASLNAGQVGNYSLVVTTGQRGSGGVAATDGVVLGAGAGLRDSFGEMVQSASQGGGGTFRFTVTAPAYGGTIRLWGVGLASNGGGTGGDRAAHVTRDITIVGPPAPPDAGTPSADGGADGGSSSGGTSSSSGSGGTSSSSSGGPEDPDGDDDGEEGSPRERSFSGPRAGSCSAAPGVSPEATFAVVVAALAAFARRGRRRSQPTARRPSPTSAKRS